MKSSQRNSAAARWAARTRRPPGQPAAGRRADSDHERAHAAVARPARGPAVALLDQTRLPAEEKVVTCDDVPELVDAIRRLVVRGAPILGVAGAFGVALAACRGDDVAAAARALGDGPADRGEPGLGRPPRRWPPIRPRSPRGGAGHR